MSEIIQPTAGSRLLGLTALSGEFPVSALSRLVGESRYKEKIVTGLKARKLLKTYYRDGVRAYRLTPGGRKLLLQTNAERFNPIFSEPPQMRSDLPHRLRMHQMCELVLAMQKAGVPIFPDEKAPLFSPRLSVGGFQHIRLPAYYTSREVKGIGIEGTKIKNARFCGILLTGETIFLCYNAGNTIMRWEQKSEIKTRAMLSYLICRDRLPGRYPADAVQAIVLGTDMAAAQRLLENQGPRVDRAFRLDQTFEHLHFIPNDTHGDLLLHLLCDMDLRLNLNATLSAGLCMADPAAAIENDGFGEDGTPILFAFDGDLQRLSNYVQMLNLSGSHGQVFCFDFQAATFQHYCGERIELQTIDTNKFRRRFLAPEEEDL